ncbi:MAG TPA: hypothetical protein VFB12_14230 [Ktedonobacteraceae bacterium]|nr:hypothetical protein [Ktedonobacteraceae bacterium]
MRKYHYRLAFLSLVLLTLSLQSCLSIGGSSPFKTTTTSKGGSIGVNNQIIFKGKIYFTLSHNLYVLDGADGTHTPHQLTQNMYVQDPAVSPDGKWIAFIVRNPNYSDLVYRSTNTSDTTLHTVVTGKGQYFKNADGDNNLYWFAQPAWSADSTHLLFVSDLQKHFYWGPRLGGVFANALFLDMQVFSLPINQTTLTAEQAITTAQAIGYANFGDGGDRDPSYRPNHPEQVVYTHYSYDTSQTKQVDQIFLEDTTFMQKPNTYHPGITVDTGFDPAVAITKPDLDVRNIQPAFSPDGNYIAYVHTSASSTQMGLYVMQVPDGVTATPNDPTTAQKALVPYQSASLLLQQQFVSQPFWSPDYKQIAYLGYNNNKFDIWMATLKKDAKTGAYSIQGAPIQLTDATDLDGDSRPFWTV